jgi:ribonucleotide reductase alpha subunit
VEQATLATRKIGVGVMGLAELLAGLGIPYNSQQAVRLAARIARTIRQEAQGVSRELATERGPFPLFGESVFAAHGSSPLRNAQVMSIAPTGTISVIAGTTSGIEPMFAVSYVRNVLGTGLVEANPRFEQLARERGFYPRSATVDELRDLYLAAWRARVKGITIYRYGSRSGQVLTFLSESPDGPAPPVQVNAEYAGGCAGYACEL